ncbi:hypothetical protein [Psychrobacter alimentarius]|uniref:hypothetical protein n=1 Tax=Psychrobacter alimentarius TaxID=261164 RepID=UPI001919DB1D|nr:hypothetical protein [Psychrobacter alimentarius]
MVKSNNFLASPELSMIIPLSSLEIILAQTPEYLDRFMSSKVVGRYVVNVKV